MVARHPDEKMEEVKIWLRYGSNSLMLIGNLLFYLKFQNYGKDSFPGRTTRSADRRFPYCTSERLCVRWPTANLYTSGLLITPTPLDENLFVSYTSGSTYRKKGLHPLRGKSTRATIKAHPAAPHLPRPYRYGIPSQGWRTLPLGS